MLGGHPGLHHVTEGKYEGKAVCRAREDPISSNTEPGPSPLAL